ncbi:MAG: hypothetical protein CMH54_05965 [Myxococcales bacterium]|nr:hypothetical protein [Myxococcales bacterium]
MKRILFALILSGLVLASATVSTAQIPARQADRPLTLKQGVVAADVGVGHTMTDPTESTDASLGFVYGVLDDLQLGLSLPMGVDPTFETNDPAIVAIFRMHRTQELEAGLKIETSIPVKEGSAAELNVGAPVRWRSGPLRIDTGVVLGYALTDPAQKSLQIPIGVSYNLNEHLAFQLNTGVRAPEFEFDKYIMPLGAGLVYTLTSQGMTRGDIGVSASFPFFMQKGNVTTTDFMVISVGGRAFF